MTTMINNLRKQVDIPVWEWLRFAPVASAVPSASCSANNPQYNPIHGRYIYFLLTAANFWRYDTVTDTYEQLQTPPIAPATWADIEFEQCQGIEGLVLAATATTVTLPAYSSGALKGYDIKIIGGTGMGQRRIISHVNEPIIAETGVVTGVNNVLGALTLTDATKAWTPNQWVGYQVRISFGTGIGQVRRVLYNSATVLTLGDSTLSAQNVWCNPNITNPAVVNTAGAQSVYVIESSVATVDTPWLVTPDATSQYMVESGVISLYSSAAATPFYTCQYYDIASDTWYIKTANTLNVSAAGTDGTCDHAGFAATVWTRGSVTSATSTTLTDTTKDWGINSLAGLYVNLVGGTGEGQLALITTNTNTVLTFAALGVTPDATTDYMVEGYDCGTATAGASSSLTDTTKNWPVNRWANFIVKIMFGTGKGQYIQILSNTTTTLTFVKPLATTPDTTSTYSIIPDGQKTYVMLGGQATTFIYNYADDLMTESRWHDSGTALSAAVAYGTLRPIGIASAAHVGTNATLTTSFPHCLKVGMSVKVAGMTDPNYNTTATITSVPSTTQLTYTMAGTPAVDTLAGVQNTTVLTDATKNWTVNQWVGYLVYLTASANTAATGLATGQVAQVIANTANQLILMSAITTPVSGRDRYILTPRATPGMFDNGVATGTQSTSLLTDTTKASSFNASVSAGSTTLTVNPVTFTASFANNQMTLVTPPVNGILQVGNLISGTGLLPNCIVGSLASGTANTVGAVYNLLTQGVVANAGGQCSLSGSSMTITTVPTTGVYAPGQIVSGTGIVAGTTIVSLTSGPANTVGAVYLLSQAVTTESAESVIGTLGIGTLAAETVTAYPQGLLAPGMLITSTASTGAMMSFATNVMTLNTIPTGGSIALGQTIQTAGAANGAVIVALASGTLNVVGSTYTLSFPPGTIANQAATTTNATFATGGSASFATNQMTLTAAPTLGSLAIGQQVFAPAGTALPANTTITGLVSGNLNAVGSVYSLNTSPGTIAAQAFTAHNGTGSFGGQASFATNVMTLTTAPTVGALAQGAIVTAGSVAPGTTLTGLLSGTWNAVGSSYSLSTYPGTVGAEAFTSSAIAVGAVLAQQLTSTMPGGTLGGTGTYQLSLPAANTLSYAQLSYMWVVNAYAGRKVKLIGGAGQSQEFSVSSNTNCSIAMTAITTAPVTLATSYAVLQQPPRGTGIGLQGIFGLSDTANSGKWWVVARGGGAYGFDKLDITTDQFYAMPTSPQTETLTTGSMYAYDGTDRLYFTKEATQRCYYIDLKTNHIHGAGMYPYQAPTALLGNRMEIYQTNDGLNYLWLNRETNLECFRQLLFY